MPQCFLWLPMVSVFFTPVPQIGFSLPSASTVQRSRFVACGSTIQYVSLRQLHEQHCYFAFHCVCCPINNWVPNWSATSNFASLVTVYHRTETGCNIVHYCCRRINCSLLCKVHQYRTVCTTVTFYSTTV